MSPLIPRERPSPAGVGGWTLEDWCLTWPSNMYMYIILYIYTQLLNICENNLGLKALYICISFSLPLPLSLSMSLSLCVSLSLPLSIAIKSPCPNYLRWSNRIYLLFIVYFVAYNCIPTSPQVGRSLHNTKWPAIASALHPNWRRNKWNCPRSSLPWPKHTHPRHMAGDSSEACWMGIEIPLKKGIVEV